MEPFEVLVGFRTNSSIYLQNGYGYRRTRKIISGRPTYVKCINTWCPGFGCIDVGSTTIRVTKDHDAGCLEKHPNLREELSIHHEILQAAAANPTVRPKTIYENVANRHSVTVMASTPFSKKESSIAKTKAHFRPCIPNTYDELTTSLLESEYGKTYGGDLFFHGVHGEDFKNLIFYGPCAKSLITNGCTMQVDATFRSVPRILKLYQLLSVMVLLNDHAFPAVFILMTNKTKLAYVQIFKYLKETFGLKEPKLIITDAEKGLTAGIDDVYPEVVRLVCYFHFTKNVYLKSLIYGLVPLAKSPEGRKVLGCLLALPLLPHDRFPEGIEAIEDLIDKYKLPQFLRLVDYVIKVWIKGVGHENLSMFGEENRTTNYTESYHKQINTRSGVHPNIWLLMDVLRTVEHTTAVDHEALLRGEKIRRLKPMKYLRSALRQRELEQRLENGLISVPHFLTTSSYQSKSLVDKLLGKGLKKSNEDLLEHMDDESIGFTAKTAKGKQFKESKGVGKQSGRKKRPKPTASTRSSKPRERSPVADVDSNELSLLLSEMINTVVVEIGQSPVGDNDCNDLNDVAVEAEGSPVADDDCNDHEAVVVEVGYFTDEEEEEVIVGIDDDEAEASFGVSNMEVQSVASCCSDVTMHDASDRWQLGACGDSDEDSRVLYVTETEDDITLVRSELDGIFKAVELLEKSGSDLGLEGEVMPPPIVPSVPMGAVTQGDILFLVTKNSDLIKLDKFLRQQHCLHPINIKSIQDNF